MSTSVAPVNNVHAALGPQSPAANPDAAATFEQTLAFVESTQACGQGRSQGRDAASGDHRAPRAASNDSPPTTANSDDLGSRDRPLGSHADDDHDTASAGSDAADVVDAAGSDKRVGTPWDERRFDLSTDNKPPTTVALHSLMPPWLAPGIAANVNPSNSNSNSSAAWHGDTTWAQLGRWVDQLLVSSAAPGSSANTEARFTLSQDLFADTHAMLTRTPDGWLLRLQTDDPRLRADAKQHEAALRKRFAERGLGDLVVEQVGA
jgi:hypothetical protein